MKIYDTLNPLVTLSSVGPVVKIQPNPQGEVAPAFFLPVAAAGLVGPTHSVVSDPANLLYVQEPRHKLMTIAGMVANDTIVIAGLTFTCVAAGATGQQFNVGGSDTVTAANIVTAINTLLGGVHSPLSSYYFSPGGDDGDELPTFEASGKTSSGAGTATFVIEGSNDGVNFDATALLTLAVTMADTTRVAKIGTVPAKYSFYRARLTALTGTGAQAQCFMKS